MSQPGRIGHGKFTVAPRCGPALTALITALAIAGPHAQAPAMRLAILLAEDRRAPTPTDLATLRRGARSTDPQTALSALRALGRLERPSLIPDIVPGLTHRYPETRAEAANAVGQAAQGAGANGFGRLLTAGSVLTTLLDRAAVEDEPAVRAALAETIGRLPYVQAADVERAERGLVSLGATGPSLADRLGVAKGLEALVRLHRTTRAPGREAIEMLRALAGAPSAVATLPEAVDPPPIDPDPLRDARVRRLAIESLLAADEVDAELVDRSAADPDPQVRRLAMRGARARDQLRTLHAGLKDPSALVRFEALSGLPSTDVERFCAASLASVADVDTRVALRAVDQLASCGAFPAVVSELERIVADRSLAARPRAWHRPAHAIVALSEAWPGRARSALGQLVNSDNWHIRVYAARAAARLGDRETLRVFARDAQDNVAEAGIAGLSRVGDRADDDVLVEALGRAAYPIVRSAALALDGSASPAAVPALEAALVRLATEGRANSYDTRAAIAATLASLGAAPAPLERPKPTVTPLLNADSLRRLAAPRARVTIRGVGVFDLALFTAEAPATVLRFAELAESGYYDGLTFHRIVPNFVVQGGSPGADEFTGEASYMRDEVGLWPHVRGGVGISTRGRDTGDAQIFINLVDNPRLDHAYTVFAQVLSGIEVVDQILEGDVIERLDILP